MTNELAQSVAEKPNDVQLQTAIVEAMHTSPLTANSLIVVHVNQGDVTLEGMAMSPLARREATRLAETVLGVTAIRTHRLGVVNTQTVEIPRTIIASNAAHFRCLGHVHLDARETSSMDAIFCGIE